MIFSVKSDGYGDFDPVFGEIWIDGAFLSIRNWATSAAGDWTGYRDRVKMTHFRKFREFPVSNFEFRISNFQFPVSGFDD